MIKRNKIIRHSIFYAIFFAIIIALCSYIYNNVLIYAYRGSSLESYLNCPSDSNAIKIAKDFCDEFEIECSGNPVVNFHRSSGAEGRSFIRKLVDFNSTAISVNCKNVKVARSISRNIPPEASELLKFNHSLDLFKKMINKSSFGQCYLVDNCVIKPERIKFQFDSFSDYIGANNSGFLLYDDQSKVLTYEIMGSNWCEGKSLAKPYSDYIPINEAVNNGIKYLVENAKKSTYESSMFDLDKVTLNYWYKSINDKAWLVGFRDTTKLNNMPEGVKLEQANINTQNIDGNSTYVTVVINATTGELININSERK